MSTDPRVAITAADTALGIEFGGSSELSVGGGV